MAAFAASVEQGYGLIECDLKYTADDELVLLHDQTVNRTARKANGEAFAEPMPIKELTLAEAREPEYGSWFSEKFKGERMPTLAELLAFAEQTQIPLKIDNCWEHFPEEITEKLFSAFDAVKGRVKFGFTCAKLQNLQAVAERFPDCTLHYDGGDLSEERLQAVAELAKGHELVIWVCYDNQMTKWFQGTKATPEICARVHRYGALGIWILSDREELAPAVELGADIIETTGHIKPEWL